MDWQLTADNSYLQAKKISRLIFEARVNKENFYNLYYSSERQMKKSYLRTENIFLKDLQIVEHRSILLHGMK